jgi:glyoxylase-like metal-dependent hydrolase (beta-lactamase superfamily II)
LYNNLGSIRWSPPEITFTHQLNIHWNGSPLVLEHRPGPTAGAIWATLPEQHVVFIGDLVLLSQPPFLASAHLPTWLENLQELLSPVYQNYLIVCSRGGLVHQDDIRKQIRFLQKVQQSIEGLAQQDAAPEETWRLAPLLLAEFSLPAERLPFYQQRLKYGLHQYYVRQHRPAIGESSDDE